MKEFIKYFNDESNWNDNELIFYVGSDHWGGFKKFCIKMNIEWHDRDMNAIKFMIDSIRDRAVIYIQREKFDITDDDGNVHTYDGGIMHEFYPENDPGGIIFDYRPLTVKNIIEDTRRWVSYYLFTFSRFIRRIRNRDDLDNLPF